MSGAPELLVAAALGLGGLYFGAPLVAKRAGIRALARRAEARRALVLTYDDGPGPEVTRALLPLLAEHGARATFFVSGAQATRHPDVVRAVADAGHEVGSHGAAHVHAWRAAPWRVLADVRAGVAVARKHAGAGAGGLFRPPYGKATLATLAGARAARAGLAWWTHDSGDSHATLPARMAGSEALLARGGVVLLHDLDRSVARNDYVLATTRALLEAAPAAGLSVLTLGELLEP